MGVAGASRWLLFVSSVHLLKSPQLIKKKSSMCFSYNHRVFPSLVIVVTISFLRVHSSKIDADILSLSPPQLDIWSKSNYQVFQKVSFPFCFFLKRLLGKCDDFEVEILVLNQRPFKKWKSQTQNSAQCRIPFMWHSGKDKTSVTEIRAVIARAWAWGQEMVPRGVSNNMFGWWKYSLS